MIPMFNWLFRRKLPKKFRKLRPIRTTWVPLKREGKPRGPMGDIIRTGRPSGNSHQRRITRRKLEAA